MTALLARRTAVPALVLTLIAAPFAAPAASAPAPAAAAPAPAPGDPLVSGQLTAANFAEREVGGPDADAGFGDWYLGNGTICAALSDPIHESPLSPRGGVLIDLGHCGRRDDQWAVFQPLLNLSQKEIVPVETVEAGRDAERAWLRTRALYRGVEIVATYTLDRKTPTALDVAFRARRVAPGDRLFGLGAITLHASGQLAAFSLARGDLAASRGFGHPPNDRSSPRKLLASLVDADVTVLVGGEGWPPISYGLERVGASLREDDRSEPLSTFSITGGHYTLGNALVSPPWFGTASGRPGLAQLAQLPFMNLSAGSELALDYRIWVGERADVASIGDRLFDGSTLVRGRVDDPSARIHIALATGEPTSFVAPDPDGRFALRLPAGAYRARAVASAGRSAELDFEVPASTPGDASEAGDDVLLAPLAVGAPGWLVLPDAFIGRIVLIDEATQARFRFHASLLDFRVGSNPIPSGLEADFLNLAPAPRGTEGTRRVPVPPGPYRLLATRGPEYATVETRIEIRTGEPTRLTLAPLARLASTPGWLAADFHVHSGQSFDSALPEALQIEAFAASGAEVLVSTEHDRIFDPRGTIAERGLERELVGITGSEMTSTFEGGDAPYSSGHLNVFPLEVEPMAFRRGAIRLEGRRLRDALAELRARPVPPIVQINHPRPSPTDAAGEGYFATLGVAGAAYDPTRPFSDWPNSVLVEKSPRHGVRDLDVDAVELMNAASLLRYRHVRADWLSFLLQGERIVGTANSDSHRLSETVGLPRTYVRVADDRLARFDSTEFHAALRAGRAYGTTGPLLDVRLGGSELGDLHAGAKGVLNVRVEGAPWIPVAEWRAYVDGELVHRAPIALGGSASLPLAFARDAFVTVEVEGPAEGLYRELLPEFVPFAFSNPIFVDADGDGRFTAPGLPPRTQLPPTITRPSEAD